MGFSLVPHVSSRITISCTFRTTFWPCLMCDILIWFVNKLSDFEKKTKKFYIWFVVRTLLLFFLFYFIYENMLWPYILLCNLSRYKSTTSPLREMYLALTRLKETLIDYKQRWFTVIIKPFSKPKSRRLRLILVYAKSIF